MPWFPWKPYPIPDQNGQSVYPFSDENGEKTLPFGAAHTSMRYIGEYPHGVLVKHLDIRWPTSTLAIV